MNKMRSFWLVLPLMGILVLPGCKVVDRAVHHAVKLVDIYCTQLDEDDRAFVRQEFNERSPHKVRIECSGS